MSDEEIKALQDKLAETESKLEESVKHSREWESRAKANKAKADELEQLKAEREATAKELEERIIPASAGQT
ncbi:hypothetical protein [Bifidobacterium canis]|uniref:Uncharacterized protein n=1 Tax=Bifidobacterium canis TaxID=2610880 RepID=A0A7K1J7L5_9BIFI|nr:hypothetical protein [Bifidobacterium canis]MUH60577.1 hypothetical protein [Bifidobacterium canis]